MREFAKHIFLMCILEVAFGGDTFANADMDTTWWVLMFGLALNGLVDLEDRPVPWVVVMGCG